MMKAKTMATKPGDVVVCLMACQKGSTLPHTSETVAVHNEGRLSAEDGEVSSGLEERAVPALLLD